jgi:hypothetical protein
MCFGEMGSIIFDVPTGGTGSYLFSIAAVPDFSTEMTYNDLSPGSYSLQVQDESGCISSIVDTSLVEPPALQIDTTMFGGIAEAKDGFLEVVVSGGTEPHTFTLMPGAVSQDSGRFEFADGEAGTYRIDVTDDNDCSVSSADIYIWGLGIDNRTTLNALVYPNPTSGEITIKMLYPEQELTIEVLSLTGQVVDSRKAYTSGGELNEVMDLGHLAKGMYMIRIDGRMLKSGVVLR